jgi:PhnB protein
MMDGATRGGSSAAARRGGEAMTVRPIPEGYHTVTPTLNVEGAAKAIDFVKRAFGAEELMRMPGPGGKIMHAEVRIGDSIVMLSDAVRLPAMPANIFLYVSDADATYEQALKAGAESMMPPTDMFWGDRYAHVKDPCGNLWGIATHKEDLTPEEIAKRAAAAMSQQS